MPRHLVFAIVFIEGFCSLGAEIIALRRLVPHVGSSIVVTAPTIGFFLLALALGYAAGARVATDFRHVVTRNFLAAATLAGIGLSWRAVDTLFAHLQPTPVAYLAFVGGILCPVAWLLGQTVPILTNLMRDERVGEASGNALYWSTLGSFLGSLALSLVIMQWLGVYAAVLTCTAGLLAGVMLLASRAPLALGATAAIALASLAINLPASPLADTAYAEYAVTPVASTERPDRRALRVNNSLASLIDAGEPPRYTRYIEHLRHILLDELAMTGREVLVIGAGGFTLSHREEKNRYTYVDIDPRIRDIAERHFLRQAIRGDFLADDGRRYLLATERRFDAVVVDAFSSHTSIPTHLVTQEFWASTRHVLAPDGVLLANLLLDGRLESAQARNLLATLDAVFGRCAVEVLHKNQPLANVVVTCFASSQPRATTPYRDEQNRADLDRLAGN